jgi:hypothetical protein
MVRRTIGTLLPAAHVERAAERLHGGGFQRFFLRHRWQDAGKARGEHGLAGARRAAHQHAVPASGGDLQRAFGLCLALHFAHVRVVRNDALRLRDEARHEFAPRQMRRDLQQRLRRVDLRIFHQRSFRRVHCGQDKSASAICRAICHRQRAAYCAQLAGQRQFSGVFILSKLVGRYLSGCGENAECDGQIKAPAFLGQIGGRKIDGDAARGKFELAILQRGAHAVFAFFNFGFRQAYDGKVRQAVSDVHFDGDKRRLHSG